MAVLKCKMCGGDIQTADATYGTCESCGATSTLPKSNDEKIVNLFNRANHFRRLNEFDKAAAAYENILNEDSSNAEAHWCLVLCRYGIEYIEDPKTHERIPTCRRVQHESILSDSDYRAALENAADEYTKSLYEEEAKKISKIQKGILAISKNEEPYDVFICYKEAADGGSRTADSTLAQDIYQQLTNDGLRVFFSRITLEDKLGQEYEPYIFSALNSAKVMLVIGTKKEHFEAVWVKNEWSRFLTIMKNDRSRILIPCYKDMDVYDIPEELANLQVKDMSKIGFMQEILGSIKKVSDANKGGGKTAGSAEGVAAGTVAGVSAALDSAKAIVAQQMEQLMKRALHHLEDSEWDMAKGYFDSVLGMDVEFAPAYVGLLCADLKLNSEELLAEYENPIDKHKHFKKAVRFADTDYRNKLEGYSQGIKQRYESKKPFIAENRERIAKYKNCISTSHKHTVGLRTDGSVAAVGDKDCSKTEGWRNIVAVSAGDFHTVGLKGDGTVVAIGSNYNGQCKTEEWRDIIAIAAGENHTVGLKSDGTVIAIGENENGQCKTRKWEDIIAIFAKDEYTAGLKSDGTVVETRQETKDILSVKGWKDIVTLSVEQGSHTVGLKSDGTVVVVGDGDKCRTEEWRDIVEISSGDEHTVGLRASGTVVACGDEEYCDTGEWRDIIAISANIYHTVGLKADGTVVACGNNGEGACNTEDWKDIVAVFAGVNYTVGLKADGTVVTTGENISGRCDTEDWQGIGPVDKELSIQRIQDEIKRENEMKTASDEARNKAARFQACISAGDKHTVGLRADGTVVAVGNNEYGQCDTGSWRNIIAVSAGDYHTVGLKADGTVVAAGGRGVVESGQCDTGGWRNIVAVSAGFYHTVGLKSDGTVVVAGRDSWGENDTDDWKDIIAVAASASRTVGLKSDGTVIAAGTSNYGQNGIMSEWRNIVAISAQHDYTVGLKADGTVVTANKYHEDQCDSWEDVIAISNYGPHTVGLKSDGAVLAVGDNDKGQCNIRQWRDIVAIVAGKSHTVGLKSDGTVVAVGANDKGQCDTEDWRDIGPVVQSKQWARNGLCRFCGGELSFIGKKCKSCGEKN